MSTTSQLTIGQINDLIRHFKLLRSKISNISRSEMFNSHLGYMNYNLYWDLYDPVNIFPLCSFNPPNRIDQNAQGNERYVYWPDYRVFGKIHDIVTYFRQAGVNKVHIGFLHEISKGNFGSPEGVVRLNEQVVVTNSIDPYQIPKRTIEDLAFHPCTTQPIQELLSQTTPVIFPPNNSKFWQLFNQGNLTDVTLIATNGQQVKEISAHKVILASASDYFNSLLTGAFCETHQHKVTINLPENINPEVFERVIQAVYGEDLRTLSWDKQLQAMILIQCYQFKINMESGLDQLDIPAEGIIPLIETVNKLYDDIPDHVIDIIGSKLTVEMDLSSLSEELITALHASKCCRIDQNYVAYFTNDPEIRIRLMIS